jgi:hypothetical protein
MNARGRRARSSLGAAPVAAPRLAALALVLTAACRILPSPPPVTPSGTVPIPENPSDLSVEDVRTWRLGDRIATSFALRGPATYTVGEGVYRRSASYNAWLGTCRVSASVATCRIEAAGTETSTMGFAISSRRNTFSGAWFDGAGSLDLVESANGIAIRDGSRTLAEVAFDQRPPSGWIDGNLGTFQRARIAPLLLALSAVPDPRSLTPGPDVPIVASTTRSLARDELARFSREAYEALRPGPPQPAYGPDLRFSRPIFFVVELIGIGASFPLATPAVDPDRGAPASLSARPGYSIYGGLDWADFLQLLIGVESRSLAFDADELKKVSPPGAFEEHGHVRLAIAGRITFARAGPWGSYLGLERVWLFSDTESIFFQSDDVSTATDSGYVLMAHFKATGWAPVFGIKYKLGPVLHGGDWWSGISADIILEGRYELARWSAPRVVFQTLNEDQPTIDRALAAGGAWVDAYPSARSTRHGGARLAFQVRF